MNTFGTHKVGIVGTGMVGSSFAYALMQRGLVGELVLIDANHARAEGEAMDLNHGISFVRPMKIFAGYYEDLRGADVVVVSAGVSQKPGESRLELLSRNIAVFKEIIPEIVRYNPDGIIVVVTNPVDILTYVTLKISGLPAHKVIGTGTTLDTARLRYLLGQRYDIDPRNVHTYILGEHGDSEFAAWSLTTLGAVPLKKYVSVRGVGYDPVALEQIFLETKNAAYAIIERKSATYYAIGLSVLAIVETIIRHQHTILPVSTMMSGQFGVSDVCISLPTIIGRDGVEEVMNITLSDDEIALFQNSARILRSRIVETL